MLGVLRILCTFLILLLAIGLTGFAYPRLKELSNLRSSNLKAHSNEVLYLPNGKALNVLSFDYKTLLANILWFNTVSYFGKHYREDRNYTWLDHMCNLVTDLNPQAEHVFEFCSLMLAWESENVDQSLNLLTKAIAKSPDNWRYYYLRGVSKAIFRQDSLGAHQDFADGSTKSEAPLFLKRMASKTISGIDSPEAAIQFLKSMVSRSTNPTERAALQKHLQQTIHDYNLDQLEAAVYKRFQSATPATIDLASIIKDYAKYVDPYGGKYYWDPVAKKVKSTSAVARGKSLVKKPLGHTEE